MSVIAWLVVGLVAGLVAKALMPVNEQGGMLATTLLGVAGATVGGLLAVSLGISDGVNNFILGTIVLPVFGAMLLLIVYRSLTGGRIRA